jgi:hypothetical protein
MTLWVTCPKCGPVLAFTPQGRVAFQMELVCECGSKCVHSEGCSRSVNKPKNEQSSC